MASRSSGPGLGTIILLVAVLTLIGAAISSFFIWLVWNVLNVHNVYGIESDASFAQIVVAAFLLGSISGGSRIETR